MTEWDSRYDGRCVTCGNSFPVGTRITRGERGGYKHVSCPANAVNNAVVHREIADGMYFKDGIVYKVQHAYHGTGNQYAKRLEVRGRGNAKFVYDPGAVRKLIPENQMTIDQALEFGALYGVCCRCGRILTNEGSIEAGIGPICGGHFFPNVTLKEQRRLARVMISRGLLEAKTLYAKTPRLPIGEDPDSEE